MGLREERLVDEDWDQENLTSDTDEETEYTDDWQEA